MLSLSKVLPVVALVGSAPLWLPSSTATSSRGAAAPTSFDGGVFVMSNEFGGNRVFSYGRASDGTLTPVGATYTGGVGASFDGGEGLDPLISAYALEITEDKRFVLATNAGSNSVSVLRIEAGMGLTLVDVEPTLGVGPNSIAVFGDLVYVSSIDADGVFAGEPDQEGGVVGFRMTPSGNLIRIPGAARPMGNRPSAVRFSPDGKYLGVTSINAGAAGLASGNVDELTIFGVRADGRLTRMPTDAASSTLPFNPQGRNLPSAIGFEMVDQGGETFVVVTEAREFQADGSPPTLPNLQSGSVSSWRLESNGTLTPMSLDVFTGSTIQDGERTACWLAVAPSKDLFWVSNALDASISTYGLQGGNVTLLTEVAAAGTPPSPNDPFGTTDGFIDLWLSEDGKYLYQLFGLDGTVGVYGVTPNGLSLIQEVSNLPDQNTQGIVAF